jgi:hypothetical protein
VDAQRPATSGAERPPNQSKHLALQPTLLSEGESRHNLAYQHEMDTPHILVNAFIFCFEHGDEHCRECFCDHRMCNNIRVEDELVNITEFFEYEVEVRTRSFDGYCGGGNSDRGVILGPSTHERIRTRSSA